MKKTKILLFGGSGRLGTELRKLRPDIIAPTREELDVISLYKADRKINEVKPDVVIHAAAMVGTKECENDKVQAWMDNVVGTRNVALACHFHSTRMVFISSAVVFDGEKGLYTEHDIPSPTTHYALTKVIGEQLVDALVRDYVAVRLDFFPLDGFKYDRVFIDHYTSKIPVNIAAERILKVAEDYDFQGIINIGQKRDTLFNILKPYYPWIKPIKIRDSALPNFPKDISLDLSRWKEMYGSTK